MRGVYAGLPFGARRCASRIWSVLVFLNILPRPIQLPAQRKDSKHSTHFQACPEYSLRPLPGAVGLLLTCGYMDVAVHRGKV